MHRTSASFSKYWWTVDSKRSSDGLVVTSLTRFRDDSPTVFGTTSLSPGRALDSSPHIGESLYQVVRSWVKAYALVTMSNEDGHSLLETRWSRTLSMQLRLLEAAPSLHGVTTQLNEPCGFNLLLHIPGGYTNDGDKIAQVLKETLSGIS